MYALSELWLALSCLMNVEKKLNRRKFIILVHLSFALQTNYSPPAPYKDGQRWQITLEQDIDISINLDAASKMPGEIDLKLSKTDYQYTNSFIVQYCPIIIVRISAPYHIWYKISIFCRFECHLEIRNMCCAFGLDNTFLKTSIVPLTYLWLINDISCACHQY